MNDAQVQRLRTLIDRDGRKPRTISEAAGCGPNYLSEALKANPDTRKDVTVEKLDAILGELKDGSILYVLTGIEMDPARERMIQLSASWSDDDLQAALRFFERLSSPPPKRARKP